jgi:hypothetical protein
MEGVRVLVRVVWSRVIRSMQSAQVAFDAERKQVDKSVRAFVHFLRQHATFIKRGAGVHANSRHESGSGQPVGVSPHAARRRVSPSARPPVRDFSSCVDREST